jgi:multidrug efflux pump subunit AcrB
MSNLFYRNRRLLILTLFMIVVAGWTSFRALPRLEDPRLTPRVAIVKTFYPGASPERVEALVTKKLEDRLSEFEEINVLESTSRTGLSRLSVELKDQFGEDDVSEIWSRIRDKLTDAEADLPAGALSPEFDDKIMGGAYTLIVALTWESESPVAYGVLQRLAEQLEDELRNLPGTEYTELHGANPEEISVEVEPGRLAALGLTPGDIARAIAASDVKVPAGALRSRDESLQIELAGELESLGRLKAVPVSVGAAGDAIRLGEIAVIRKGVSDPPRQLALINGKPAIVVSVRMEPYRRVDVWADQAHMILTSFKARLPRGVAFDVIFDQSEYTRARLDHLYGNLMVGVLLVVLTVLFMMGWRSSLIVALALPLTVFMVCTAMNFYGMPIHQMSITGMIIALGLLIDNAIIIADEVDQQLTDGQPTADAVSHAVKHLSVPLLGSTLTTILAFAPVLLLPGPAGEFVGPISVTVTFALVSSLVLALTVIPALKGLVHDFWARRGVRDLASHGFSNASMAKAYQRSLRWIFRHPSLAVALTPLVPIAGFLLSGTLEEQFFPPSERDMFHVQMHFPAQNSIQTTAREMERARTLILELPFVEAVHTFVGVAAPRFYYNVFGSDSDSPGYGHAIVQLASADRYSEDIQEIQKLLDEAFPHGQPLAMQLEQGPPFDAPIAMRVLGPDLDVLTSIGDELRGMLASVPDVTHTRSTLGSPLPKLWLSLDEEEARFSGLDNTQVARQMNATLEGEIGGSLLEGSEDLPVRVRLAGNERADASGIRSLDLMAPSGSEGEGRPWVPLSALGSLELRPQRSVIWHRDGERFNYIQAFITAGVLPATVLERFDQRMKTQGLDLPPGYTLGFAGEAAERNDAVNQLLAPMGILVVMMIGTLVLSMRSFRLAGVIGMVGFLAIGMGLLAVWFFQFPFGFMTIIGTMGLFGVAINDSIVVMAALREDEICLSGDVNQVVSVVSRSTRHVLSTSFTTAAGFTPLVLAGGGMWPPPAIAISGGVLGATALALIFVPCSFLLIYRKRGGA